MVRISRPVLHTAIILVSAGSSRKQIFSRLATIHLRVYQFRRSFRRIPTHRQHFTKVCMFVFHLLTVIGIASFVADVAMQSWVIRSTLVSLCHALLNHYSQQSLCDEIQNPQQSHDSQQSLCDDLSVSCCPAGSLGQQVLDVFLDSWMTFRLSQGLMAVFVPVFR